MSKVNRQIMLICVLISEMLHYLLKTSKEQKMTNKCKQTEYIDLCRHAIPIDELFINHC